MSTSCFTKGYDLKHMRGSGPVVLVDKGDKGAGPGASAGGEGAGTVGSCGFREVHESERVRFLSPCECLRLLGFPSTFEIPLRDAGGSGAMSGGGGTTSKCKCACTLKQAWAVAGNSLNVVVVARPIHALLAADT